MLTTMRLDNVKRRVQEDLEFLEETGQESDLKASRVIKQHFKAQQLKEMGQRTFFLERLDGRRKYNDYNKLCAEITLFFLEGQDLPKQIKYKVQFDTRGVLLFVAVGKKVFQRAFRSVREPRYDLNACEVFAFSVGDLIIEHGRAPKPQQA